MTWYVKLAIVAAMVPLMECVAWATHRYVMHGWGWRWHRSHHEPDGRALERNDLYALSFSVVVVALFVAGLWWEPAWWIALGISLYGVIYAVVHDLLVHQRFGVRWVPRRGYARRLLQAHRLHHAVQGRDGGISFGFLFARSPARLKRELAARVRS